MEIAGINLQRINFIREDIIYDSLLIDINSIFIFTTFG